MAALLPAMRWRRESRIPTDLFSRRATAAESSRDASRGGCPTGHRRLAPPPIVDPLQGLATRFRLLALPARSASSDRHVASRSGRQTVDPLDFFGLQTELEYIEIRPHVVGVGGPGQNHHADVDGE